MNRGKATLVSQTESLTFDRITGRLLSCRSSGPGGEEFIASSPTHPAWILQYRQGKTLHRLSSRDARQTQISLTKEDGVQTLAMAFHHVGGLNLSVLATVRVSVLEPGSRWGLTLDNQAGLEIVDLQFPFIVTRYDLKGSLLIPSYAGKLKAHPSPESLEPDSAEAWAFSIENGNSAHYPGGFFAQFLAYYTRRAGLYLACEDSMAHVKLFKTLHCEPGIRLGIAHVGDWPQPGTRTLEYSIVLRCFKGDWYDAADLYRTWTLQQHWAVPLHRRTDIPAWLLDSPAYISLRLQGELDIGPVFPVKAFLPYTKILPHLDRLSRQLQAPLAVILMAWERGGPWVYPDCFPPIGGDAALKRFCHLARQRGWRVGSYCNGTRWVTRHFWNDYDGKAFFHKNRGDRSVCRTPSGEAWQESWDRMWRPSYACCLGEPHTRQIAEKFVARLFGWGMESIQFFDQNMGAATFPCFATDHPHPPVPGRWMAESMQAVMRGFKKAARSSPALQVIHSTEAPCNETCLPLFQECDVRVIPPGHVSNYDFLPLYHYLYHECIILQGGMGMGPEPHHLSTRNACNAVLGEVPGAVMTDDGSLLNRDTGNWAPWKPAVGSHRESLTMLRNVLALRRGPGRDFLVFGRMQRPSRVKGIKIETWESNSRVNRIPAVFHAAWEAPDGRLGIALANWTSAPQRLFLSDPRFGKSVLIHLIGGRKKPPRRLQRNSNQPLTLSIPAWGCCLVESMPPVTGPHRKG
jgi:hypothetical protein